MSVLEGRPLPEVKDKIRRNFLPTLLVNWQVWPITQLSRAMAEWVSAPAAGVGARSVSVRCVFSIGLGFNTYLSYRNDMDMPHPHHHSHPHHTHKHNQ